MKSGKKKIVLVAAVLAVAAGVSGAVFFFGGNGDADDSQLKEAFDSFSNARAVGSKGMAAMYISKSFSDAGLVFETAVEEFSIKQEGYSALINNLNIRESQAEISYTRKVLIDGKIAHIPVNNEIWVKGPDGKWRLFKLSDSDRERTAKIRKLRQEEGERMLEDQLMTGMKANEVEKVKFYTHVGKRDPFESLIAELEPAGTIGSLTEAKKQCDYARRREFLEGFDLFSLKVVGVLRVKTHYALLETPNGKGYTVRNGMHLGRHCGKIVKITSDGIVVAEKILHPRQGFKVFTRELKIKREESFL
ncbi:MAG: hypothetical protein IEMM0002_0351 [bacterium]|nr:MAG: hypothetical protein IEMM0002_0351 [bacterium]